MRLNNFTPVSKLVCGTRGTKGIFNSQEYVLADSSIIQQEWNLVEDTDTLKSKDIDIWYRHKVVTAGTSNFVLKEGIKCSLKVSE